MARATSCPAVPKRLLAREGIAHDSTVRFDLNTSRQDKGHLWLNLGCKSSPSDMEGTQFDLRRLGSCLLRTWHIAHSCCLALWFPAGMGSAVTDHLRMTNPLDKACNQPE